MKQTKPVPTPTNTTDQCSCGHRRSKHVRYVPYHGHSTNAKGSPFCCTKDGCMDWSYCDLAERKEDKEPA